MISLSKLSFPLILQTLKTAELHWGQSSPLQQNNLRAGIFSEEPAANRGIFTTVLPLFTLSYHTELTRDHKDLLSCSSSCDRTEPTSIARHHN